METPSKALWLRLLPALVVVGGASSGWALFEFAPVALIGAVLKTLAVLVGSAWVSLMAFATKIADATESPSLTPDEHRRLEYKCARSVRRIWKLAALNFVAVIFVLTPSVAVDAKVPVIEYSVVLSGVAAAFAVYSIVLTARWQEELRALRSDLQLRERERQLSEERKKSLAAGAGSDEEHLRAEVAKHNRILEWPSSEVH